MLASSLTCFLVVSCKTNEGNNIPDWVISGNNVTDLALPIRDVLPIGATGMPVGVDLLSGKTVSLVGLDLSWSSTVRELCKQVGLSVLIDDQFNDKRVDIAFKKIPIRDALDTLCLSYGDIGYNINDKLVSFDTSVVQSVSVIDPLYTDATDLMRVITGVISDSSSVSTVGSNVVVGGTKLAVEQAQLITNLLGNNRPELWSVDIVILSMVDQWQQKLGIDTAIGGVVQSGLGDSVIEYVLDGTWSLEYGGGIDQVVLRTSTVLLSGSSTSINSVEEIPVPLRSVSPYGTVTITGYDKVSAGIKLKLSGIKVPDGLRVIIEPEISDISGYVNDRPIITKRNLQTTVIIGDNSIILLSGLWSDRESDNVKQLLSLSTSSSSSEWVICARFNKIN